MLKETDMLAPLICRNLHIGGLLGWVSITSVVFLFGFGGILAAWSGLFVPSGPDDFGAPVS